MKKAIVDCVDWEPQSNDIYAWRYPETNLSTWTQLIVRENQEAVFMSKGQIIGKFGPGKHVLDTQNLPILRNLFGIPFGGKNPFTAEVWFVNKASPLTIDWKTTPARFLDPDYGQMIPIVSTGRYGLKVKDAEKFLIKLVGTMPVFDTEHLSDHFRGALVAKTNSAVISFMTQNQVGIMQIAGCLDNLSTFIKDPLCQFWNDYGIEMTGFYITSVDLDLSTEDGRKISAALSDRSAQNIAGYTWQQKQGMNTINNAVNNSRGGLGMIGAAMMMNGMGGSGIGQQMMQPNQMGMQRQNGGMGAPMGGMGGISGMGNPGQNVREIFCTHCGKKFPSSSRFCTFCGDPYNPCPVCGADNDLDSKRCSACGASLVQSNATESMLAQCTCGRCGTPYKSGMKFCSNCGNKLV